MMMNISSSRSAVIAGTILCTLIATTTALADLLVASYSGRNVLRYDSQTGAFIDELISANDQGLGGARIGLALGPDGLLYVSGGAGIGRYEPNTGNFIDVLVSPITYGYSGGIFGPDGDYYVGNYWYSNVRCFDGKTMADLGVFASDSNLIDAISLTFGPNGDLYVSSFVTDQVMRFNGQTGAYVSSISAGSALDGPWGLAFGSDDNLYVSSFNSDTVLRFNIDGTFQGVFANGGGLDGPRDLKFGPDGNLYVVSTATKSILRYNGTTGAFIDEFVTSGSGGLVDPKHILFIVPEPTSLALWTLCGITLLRRTRR
ncbi:MAG: hypothetical protein IT443_08305 [Phycisphaeraceae bacterium]|nr:hypothetical protein [Phycisphaeraceae bacterium]